MSIENRLTTIAENEEKVFNAGKQTENDAFWEALQDGGKRKNYRNAFAYTSITGKMFNPKYDLIPEDAYYMFFGNGQLTDLTEEAIGVKLDFSQATEIQFAFYGMVYNLRKVGVIDARAVTYGNLNGLFNWDTVLEKVEKLIVKEELEFNSTFNACYSLKDIIFEGVIGQDLNMGDCPLSAESIDSIIQALSGTASGKTLTLKKAAKEAAFTDTEWAALIATKSNWTFSLV